MHPPTAAEVRVQLLGRERAARLAAVTLAEALVEADALELLGEAAAHWDRDLRFAALEAICRVRASVPIPLVRKLLAERRLSLRLAVRLTVEFANETSMREFLTVAVAGTEDAFTAAVATELAELEVAQGIVAELELERRTKLFEEQRAAEAARLDRLRWLDFQGLRTSLALEDESLQWYFSAWLENPRHFDGTYTLHTIEKRHGGFRKISAPEGPLVHLQRAILDQLLAPIDLHEACHGFRTARNTASNAEPHVGNELVINLDLRDFFPTITSARVAGLFRQLDLPGGVVGRAFLVDAVTHRGRLPQGAPTSPAIANLICRRLDARLGGLAAAAGATYTRYADDLTFSGPAAIASMLPSVRKIVAAEGFTLAANKTRLMRSGRRQDVTGLTVNEQVSVPRAVRRRLRAAMHGLRMGRTPHWKGAPLSEIQIRGHLAYLQSLHPEEARELTSSLQRG